MSKESSTAKNVKWPKEDDLIRLAKAVDAEEDVVVFTDGRKFKIRDTNWNAVYISPIGEAFVPCGYFDIARLKEVLK